MNISKFKNFSFVIIIFNLLLSCSVIKSIINDNAMTYPVTTIEEYRVKGIVFSDTTEFPFPSHMYPKKFKKRFAPTLNEIVLFEKIFHEKYEEYTKRKSLYNPDIDNSGKAYRKWGRHYYGYLDEEGQKFLLVYFTLLESRSDRKKWQQGPFVRIPGQWSLFINLKTKELLGWSDVNQ